MHSSDAFHSVVIRYVAAPNPDGSPRQPPPHEHDVFFISDVKLLPRYGCYLSALRFPRDLAWIRVGSRVLASDGGAREIGENWFRWDKQIRCADDLPCQHITNRVVDVII